MKILLLNTSARTGGAAVAANRLRKALQKEGIDVSMLVRDKEIVDASISSVNTTGWKVEAENELIPFLLGTADYLFV